MRDIKNKINTQIDSLTKELHKIGDEIEIERLECCEEDTSTTQDLLDKKYMLETQIEDLQSSLMMIENNKETFGQKYEIEINGIQRKITIVHRTEANPSDGKISNESPLAKALKDSKKGGTVSVETPAGVTVYKVLR